MIRRPRTKSLVLPALAGTTLAALAFVPRLPQDPAYHDFADQARHAGVPHFWNVVSNLPFLALGAAGLGWLRRRGRPDAAGPVRERAERPPLALFFAAVLLTGFGSAWYHLAPGDDRLLADRLPLVLISTALACIAVQERWSVRAGALLLWPLASAGVLSVVFWWASERAGHGDLRLYVWINVATGLAVFVLLFFDEPRYAGRAGWLVALGLYALARLAELFDRQIAALPLLFSGHTWKHLLAAAAAAAVTVHLARRRARDHRPSASEARPLLPIS